MTSGLVIVFSGLEIVTSGLVIVFSGLVIVTSGLVIVCSVVGLDIVCSVGYYLFDTS